MSPQTFILPQIKPHMGHFLAEKPTFQELNRHGFSRREADGKNRIGLSARQDEGIWQELRRGFGVDQVGLGGVKVLWS
ncbi:MAG: hypothetical protein ISS70_25840 [Phycisphaerae bacterium]|nr:hypothetical protein [Phycisphaerae bacterium]